MIEHRAAAGPDNTVEMRFTTTADGDFAVQGEPDALARSRGDVHPGRWTWLKQVHGNRVVVVERPGEHAGVEADASATTMPGTVLAVQTADCAPVVLFGDSGQLAVAHAGWRGVVGGVLANAVGELRRLGAHDVGAVVGPCIGAECYEFGPSDLEPIVDRLGPSVVGKTTAGTTALDLRAAVVAELGSHGVAEDQVGFIDRCTSCSAEFYSHRARTQSGRMATVAWLEPS